eukprot:6498667-Pyramimonas_sp.AAC.1
MPLVMPDRLPTLARYASAQSTLHYSHRGVFCDCRLRFESRRFKQTPHPVDEAGVVRAKHH